MQFLYEGGDLKPASLDAALVRRALGHALLPSWLYKEKRYRLAE
jgi:hypothetical protein